MSGRPVVLVHGVGSSFDHNWRQPGWVDLIAELGRPVIGVELPGHGADAATADPTSIAADLIVEQADAHDIVDAVGFSAGGHALMVAASQSPASFGRIALLGVADSGLAENRDSRAAVQSIVDRLVAPAEPEGDVMARMIRRLAQSAGNDPPAVAAFLASEQPPAGLADLAKITAATLIVEGGADLSGPAELISQAVPKVRRLVLKGVDHFAIPADFRCMDAVLTFLGEAGA